jgi:hypothetical protein
MSCPPISIQAMAALPTGPAMMAAGAKRGNPLH